MLSQPFDWIRKRVEMRPFEQFAIRYTKENELQIIDQTQLPDKELWITAKDYKDMGAFIKRLSVRGAPMIGVAAVSPFPFFSFLPFFFSFLSPSWTWLLGDLFGSRKEKSEGSVGLLES